MPTTTYEIRVCRSCGLRYPLVTEHAFETRCPACMGETRLVLRRDLVAEPGPVRPEADHRSTTSLQGREDRLSRRAVVLDNIRSAWNVGSILHTADGFGFDHAFLCGISPTPENKSVKKTSLGAQDSVPWSYHKDAVKLVRGLKKEGWLVWALEDDGRAVPMGQPESGEGGTVLIVGNEVSGVDPALLDLCDAIQYIPMRGKKKSFNVAIAFAVAAFAMG
jgi:23S rRNA (guanosine2251-2'-O)-methyltransferase